MTSPNSNSDHPVGQRLRAAGIDTAVIIDDAYDQPGISDLRLEIAEFWAYVENDDDVLNEMQIIKPGINDVDDIDNDVVKALWSRVVKDDLSDLGEICKSILFARQIERLKDLNTLRRHLVRLGIEIILMGREDELPSDQVKLFFLDFFLGPDPSPLGPDAVQEAIRRTVEGTVDNASIQASIDMAEAIRQKFDDAFIVLMSSKPNVELARDKFRDESNQLEGLFGYVSKEDLEDEKELFLRLGTWAMGMPARHNVQHFVDALVASVEDVHKEFTRRVKSLSLEDYIYIHSLGLRDEGHPLGDYMLWLYKALLAHLVHNNPAVLDEQKILDSLDIDQYIPLNNPPSTQLAEIYRLALTEPGMNDIERHPAAEEDSNDPYLRLGDLFIKDKDSDVFVIITADCDLAYSPQNPKRQFPSDISVMLEPGRLESINTRVNSDAKVTHLFIYKGESFKIVWDPKRVISKKYGNVWEWLDQQGYVWETRLITPHALEVQQHFAARLTRVGMPVRPPVYRRADVEVYYKNEEGSPQLLNDPISQGAIVVDWRDDSRNRTDFSITVGCASALIDKVGEGINLYISQKDSLDKTIRGYKNKTKKLTTIVEKLQVLKDDYGEWFAILENLSSMPNANGLQLGSQGILKVYCNSNMENCDASIGINLRFDEWEPISDEEH